MNGRQHPFGTVSSVEQDAGSGAVRRARGAAGWALGGLCAVGCAAPAEGPLVPADRCQLRVWYRPDRALARPDLHLTRAQAEAPQVVGSWDGFARPGIAMADLRVSDSGDRWLTLALPLPPGRYLYGIWVGDEILTDDISPQSAFGPDPRYRDSGPYEAEWTLVTVPDCTLPTLTVASIQTSGDGRLSAEIDFSPGASPVAITAQQIQATLRSGDVSVATPAIDVVQGPDGSARIRVLAQGLSVGKYALDVVLQPPSIGDRTPPPLTARASAFVEPQPASATGASLQPPAPLSDALVYHVLIDRFAGDAGALAPPASPGRRAGGTLSGLQRVVEAGYFEWLGVTTLWLSPLYENPRGLLTGRDGHQYEAYHGYWPQSPRRVEGLLGGEPALTSLISAAHRRGLRVIFDAVPNHVYAAHPYYDGHSRRNPAIAAAPPWQAAAQSWFHDDDSACVCGAPGCGWGDRIEDCWFDRYLPDLNWRHPDVLAAGVDDLLWWLDRFDMDGMRIDAVPMMPRAATRRMALAARQARRRLGIDLLLLGENYTGPGDSGRRDIRSYLGQAYDGLDSAFDFPLMWAIRDALASERSGLPDLETEIARSQAAWRGSGAVMGLILDNHDTPRFLSEAAGDAGSDPWNGAPPQPTTDEPYRKLGLALSLMYTLPGMPVLYYGDEVGLAGAGDPDSRRVMPDVLKGALSAPQASLLALTQKMARLRRCLPALRRGDRQPLYSEADILVAQHRDPSAGRGDAAVVVVLSRARNDKRIFFPAPGREGTALLPGRYRDALSDDVFDVSADGGDRLAVTARALHAAIYVPQGHPCLAAAAGGSFDPVGKIR